MSAYTSEQETAAIDWLYSMQLFGIKLGLENSQRLLTQWQLPAQHQQFIHVAGTNGKGSTCAFLHALFNQHQINCGLFTSPHLIHFGERIRDHQRQINREELVQSIHDLQHCMTDWQPPATFFELTFALALNWFRQRQLPWAILETGMGGRLDATNVITPAVSVITSISMDHEATLGADLASITAEKAGIIKPKIPVVTLRQDSVIMQVLQRQADLMQAPLHILEEPLIDYEPSLFGKHQRFNASLALKAFELAGFQLNTDLQQKALRNTSWPGRFQHFPQQDLILDGAHNEDSIRALVQTWQQRYPQQKTEIIYGSVKDRELEPILNQLQEIASSFKFTSFNNPRARTAENIAEVYRDMQVQHLPYHCNTDLRQILQDPSINCQVPRLLCGSLYLIGESLSILQGKTQHYEVSAQ